MNVPLSVGLNDESVGLELHALIDLPNLTPTLWHGANLVFLNIEYMVAEVEHVEAGPLVQTVDHEDPSHSKAVTELFLVGQVLVVILLAQILVLVHAE